MCLSEAESIVILTLPDLSSGARRRARLFPRMVPPIPPPTITIRITALLSFVGTLFRFPDDDAPDAGFLPCANELMAHLFHPFRDVDRRTPIGGQHLELVANLRELKPRDQLHQRPWAIAS